MAVPQLPYLHFTALLAEECPRHPIIMLESRHVSMRLHARVGHVCFLQVLPANTVTTIVRIRTVLH